MTTERAVDPRKDPAWEFSRYLALAEKGTVLYVSGEESLAQSALRARRIQIPVEER